MGVKGLQQAVHGAFSDAVKALQEFTADTRSIERVATFSGLIAEILGRRGRVLICGNGGSYCDALHFAEEFTGRYRKDREALPVLALGGGGHITCVGNDFGFGEIFARQVQAFGQPGDLLIGLSTSGNSENILRAIEQAQQQGLKTAALLGKDGGKIKGKCDFEWIAPGATADRIQEVHMCLLHIAIEAVERQLFPRHYA